MSTGRPASAGAPTDDGSDGWHRRRSRPDLVAGRGRAARRPVRRRPARPRRHGLRRVPRPCRAQPAAGAGVRPGAGRLFVTNNASRTPGGGRRAADVARDRRACTARRRDERAGGRAPLAERLRPGGEVLVVGGAGVREAARGRGHGPGWTVPTAGPPAVRPGLGPRAALAAARGGRLRAGPGVPWVATNTDLTLPTGAGIAPGQRLVRRAAAGTGRPVAGRGRGQAVRGDAPAGRGGSGAAARSSSATASTPTSRARWPRAAEPAGAQGVTDVAPWTGRRPRNNGPRSSPPTSTGLLRPPRIAGTGGGGRWVCSQAWAGRAERPTGARS